MVLSFDLELQAFHPSPQAPSSSVLSRSHLCGSGFSGASGRGGEWEKGGRKEEKEGEGEHD